MYKYLLLLLVLSVGCKKMEKENIMQAPIAEKISHELSKHGDVRNDPYYWLREREDTKVIDYLNDENAYTNSIMKHTEKLQTTIFEEIKGRIKKDDNSVPYLYNDYYYYTRFEKDKEYPIYCRKKGNLDATEEIMMDANIRAKPHKYFSASGLDISHDNNLLAYGVDVISRRKYTLQVKNLKTGELLADRIENTTGSVAWAKDNKTFFYTRKDESLRSYKIFKHVMGTDSKNDVEIFHEQDDTFNCSVYLSRSNNYIMIASGSTLSDEFYYLDANTPNAEFTSVQPRKRGLEYSVEDYGDQFYIVTNDKAKNFRLMETNIKQSGIENWKEVIAHRDKVMIEGFTIFKDHLVIQERSNALPHIRVIKKADKSEYYIPMNDDIYVAYTRSNHETETNILRFSYTSPVQPSSVYDFNMDTKESTLMKKQEVLGGYDQEQYSTERIFATAEDGTKIPISLVYKKGVEKDAKNPTVLYAYGSYGHTIEPYFSIARLSLLDRGFIWAIAHVRGGEIYGRQWYEDGKLLKKKNTFTDFIDCGKHLVEEKYTSSENMTAMGGSAGGLLMGAVANMAPNLFKGIVAQVPFVDVITTMLDETIPLTTGEYDEWGNPNEKESYDYMLSYSPYDQVEKKAYPAMLVTTGLHDSQVQYWEPAKWVAKLRDMKTDDNILLMKTNMEAGHGGASGRFTRIKEVAFEYAFLLNLLGRS